MHAPKKNYHDEVDELLKRAGWVAVVMGTISLGFLGFVLWLATYVVTHIWP